MRSELKIGIIGGSGMEDPGFISDFNSKDVSTPYGDPSSQLILGSIEDVMVVSIVPITIAGAGIRDIAAVYFFSLVGIERSVSLGLSLLNLTAIFIIGIIGGILYLVVYHRLLQAKT